ncbi:uncharacterized protein LOC135702299 [Ochlerotatus camptorhynchus]|uniref:uncharacterized protein LOC135702299 n=1 Tax=Ochlerotatus camptorhynchus TaxID=644619 RepID=UPI0031D4A253
MKELGAFVVCTLLVAGVLGAPNPCENLERLRVCNETQYELYRDCVEEVRLLRAKRQILCPLMFATVQEDVVVPSVQIIPALQNVVTVNPIAYNHIPDLKPMLKSLDRKVLVQTDDEDYEYRVPTNVTTIIRLTNVVNNTNIVNVPTNVNATNVNNIHIYANNTDGGDEVNQVDEQRCCTAVQPKSCHSSTQGFKCKHNKFRTCGPQCTADIVHVQRRKRCNSHGNCKQKLAYVPQPQKPKCVYIEQWPFVVCGKPANMKVVCDGCYDHYGYGFQAFNGQLAIQCIGCYDDAFDQGPLYRRGPVLRPFYYHEPPCYITGQCPIGYDDCGYGCYGHDMIDPAWGTSSLYDPKMNEANTVYLDQQLNMVNDTENDWGSPVHKCTVISDDNTISVQNCTDMVDNQYAAAPSNYPYYRPPQVQQKPVYKVKQTTLRQNIIEEEVEDSDPSSGDGVLIQDSAVPFVEDEDEYYDYSQ